MRLLIIEISNSAFITFSSQGSSCPSPTYLLISISAFFSGKIPSHVAARLTRKYWVPNFRHFVTIPPPPPPLFAIIRYYSSPFETIRHYSRLFVTIRHYSHCSYYSLFAIRDYSLFGIRYSRLFAIRYSGFPDTQRWNMNENKTLENDAKRLLSNHAVI